MENVSVEVFDGGYCLHSERSVIRGGRLNVVKFPSMFFLIRHPTQGNILFDTGYSNQFHQETKHFPEKLYSMITPVRVSDCDLAVTKLRLSGIDPEDIHHIILSHFHADHMAALSDFPRAKIHYMDECLSSLLRLSRFGQVRQGFLRGLLPDNFEKRSMPFKKSDFTHTSVMGNSFEEAYDFFGDGLILGVSLPGHVKGQLGLYIAGERPVFLVSDACWLSKAYRENLLPSPLAMLFMNCSRDYKRTLTQIHSLYKYRTDIVIMPSHCGEIWKKHALRKSWNETNVSGLVH